MTTVKIGCKNNMIDSKKDRTNFIIAELKTSEKTYKAFDIEVPDEKRAKAERKKVIKKVCPHCKETVNIKVKWNTKKDMRRATILAIGLTITLLHLILFSAIMFAMSPAKIYISDIIIFFTKGIIITWLAVAGLIYSLCREPKDKKIMCKPIFKTDNPNHFLQYTIK